MPGVEVITVAGVPFDCDVFLPTQQHKGIFDCELLTTHPLSAVMKTKATSALVAVLAADARSVSLKEDLTVVPSAFARVVIASTGYREVCAMSLHIEQVNHDTYSDEVRVVSSAEYQTSTRQLCTSHYDYHLPATPAHA